MNFLALSDSGAGPRETKTAISADDQIRARHGVSRP